MASSDSAARGFRGKSPFARGGRLPTRTDDFQIVLSDMHGLPDLLNRVIGVAAWNLEELLIGSLLGGDPEPLRCRVPFCGRLRKRALGVLPAPDCRTHAVDGQRIVLPAWHDH